MDNRWSANKLGLIDFWYYDNEEFELSEGKLLLRGTNGSGKSVTMQSFIPLLLDGNKSPERLDPFGTRSRKLENYLLDDDTDEKTAYLYIEFKRNDSENYITLGMGLRAQKGKPMDSWYFIISDGRRVNRDIFLYKNFEAKVALTKKQLQNELSSGNFFTESQQKYMAKVNEVLFGYEDVDGYEELLNLLIQLRSPKLSKDFKPTEIYNILTNSLKLLSEDDLRPMSESMENMDSLQNSLEEKERALKSVNNIKYYYDKYNTHCLYEKAREYETLNTEVNNKKRQIDGHIREERELAKEREEVSSHITKLREELSYSKEKYENLRNNDAFKIKEKIQALGKDISELKKEIEDKERQLENKKRDQRIKDNKYREALDQRDMELKSAAAKLNELMELAREFSFSEGEYIEKEVLGNIDSYDFSYLDVCLQKYITRIREVKGVLKEYEVENEKLNNCTQSFDKLKFETQIKEGDLNRSNMLLTEVKEELKEKYNRWAGSNKYLKLEKFSLNELFKNISGVDGSTDSRIINELDRPVYEVFNAFMGKKTAEGEFLKSSIVAIEAEIAIHKTEIERLLQEKDVEPIREEGILINRQRLRDNNIAFVPLYKAIDFNKETNDKVRKSIESALNDMGILDALIINSKDKERVLSFEENAWDKYIFTAGNIMRHNLSSYCTVYKEELQGVAVDEVYNILQGIYLDEDETLSLDEEGNYVFGALKGKASMLYEPKYIGVLARKRHRDMLIENKEIQIKQLLSLISDKQTLIVTVNEGIKSLDMEYSNRPSIKDIQEGINLIENIARDLQRLENEIIKVDDELYKIKKTINELKGKLFEVSQGIELEKTLSVFEDAEDVALDFKGELANIKIIQGKIKNHIENIKVLAEAIEDIGEDIDNLYGEISIKKNKQKHQDTESKALTDTLGTFDIGGMEAEMDACIKIIDFNPGKLEELQVRIGEIKGSIIGIEEKLTEERTNLEVKEESLKLSEAIFLEELSLKYVFGEEKLETKIILKKALQIVDDDDIKDKNYYSEQLIEAHHKNSGDLREFNSKIVQLFEEEENRDRQGVIKSRSNTRRRIDISCRVQGKDMAFYGLLETIKRDIEELKLLVSTEERRIFEEVLLNTISSKISAKIYLSKQWVDKINNLMESMNTSSSLALSLKWIPKKAEREDQLDISELLDLLEMGGKANDEDMKKLANHFGDKVKEAIRSYSESGEARNYHSIIKDVLDYRQWFEFKLFFTKKNEKKSELTNHKFFQFSGGEKAMSMYIPLFSAVYARYENARGDCPRIISMDEAFAGVDENNIRDMFRLLKELRLDFVLNSQILWGDYDTVDNLSICELIREENDDVVTIIRYHWNGIEKKCLV